MDSTRYAWHTTGYNRTLRLRSERSICDLGILWTQLNKSEHSLCTKAAANSITRGQDLPLSQTCEKLALGVTQKRMTTRPSRLHKGVISVSVRASHLVRYSWLPVLGQQLIDGVVLLRRQAGHHILQVGIWVMPVQLG